ncbi:Rhomboid protein 2 [Penicillium concentricum]|uniref:Rhomboid protein 2 n=1 Tax=Penicillium concentricum TaxID=293559 RepID=A0A9W9SCC9_9EURO|nr:Rhomboid protein 2 [Penicillium concentricum]KAJ5374569.1 Rhomboid protein 2 [Penicillium concentricum]
MPAAIRNLRNNPNLLFVRLPNLLSFICIVVGVVWLLLLPLNEYSRQTYISENALLPGQVHAYFTGSEQNIFRGYKKELEGLLNDGQARGGQKDEAEVTAAVSDKLQSILQAAGLKVATQKYEYTSAGITHRGENTYAIIHAPRGDATEAIVLVAPWKTADDELNLNGVTLALTLARYFKRWSLWSKDIIFLITPDSKTGTQAWIDAYHDMHPASVQPLPLKSGALQGALVIEYPFDHRFQSLHIVYDGVNGQLPNLDLFNTAVAIAGGQMGIGANLQEMWGHDDSYEHRLQTMFRGMTKQGLGYATGAHSSFMPYHIDAITLQTKGEGWEDEMALGRTIESLCRSLNNLLEHLHQSFFFYLLMQSNRFVSIGTYLPSAMLIAGNFTIMAIALWMRTGYYPETKPSANPKNEKAPTEEKPKMSSVAERHLALPLSLVVGLHLLGLLPLWVFNNIFHQYFTTTTYIFVVVDIVLPLLLAAILSNGLGLAKPIIPQQYHLIKSFSLLLLGLSLSTLATLNFSLSFMIGLLCAPLSFVTRLRGSAPFRLATSSLGLVLLNLVSPPTVLLGVCWYTGVSVEAVLTQAAFGWDVWGYDTCSLIANKHGITEADIEKFNKDTWAWLGCKQLYQGDFICLSSGKPPMPMALPQATCGPQVPGTVRPAKWADLAGLNPCASPKCCAFWGQCGVTELYCQKAGYRAPPAGPTATVKGATEAPKSLPTKTSAAGKSTGTSAKSQSTSKFTSKSKSTTKAGTLDVTTVTYKPTSTKTTKKWTPEPTVSQYPWTAPWEITMYSERNCEGDYYHLEGYNKKFLDDKGCLAVRGGLNSQYTETGVTCKWWTDNGFTWKSCDAGTLKKPESWVLKNGYCSVFSTDDCDCSDGWKTYHQPQGCYNATEKVWTPQWESLQCSIDGY